MGKNVFSVPIFIICLRESVEASIIISVLLALVEQIVYHTPTGKTLVDKWSHDPQDAKYNDDVQQLDNVERQKRLVKRLRIQIFAGAFLGLFCAMAIGAAFLAVYYTTLNDLYSSSEEIWEGVFSLVACVMIFIMGLTMMKIDRAKIKWKVKLSRAFEGEGGKHEEPSRFGWLKTMFGKRGGSDRSSNSSKYLLFFLPFVTVLREGLEAVVFVGGVSLGLPASSIPLAAIVGVLCGLLFGFLLYRSSSRLNLSIFLVISTAFLMLIGAGLLAKAAFYFILNDFVAMVGGDAAEAGAGPGSFPVDGYIWHVNYGNPELKTSGNGGWQIFSAIFGWFNTGYYWTVLLYIAYWFAVIVALIYMKWSEGRTTIFGIQSQTYKNRMARRANQQHQQPLTAANRNTSIPTSSGSPARSVEDEKKTVGVHK